MTSVLQPLLVNTLLEIKTNNSCNLHTPNLKILFLPTEPGSDYIQ